MMEILGKPMVERLVERVSRADRVERVVLAAPDRSEDDALADLAAACGIECFRGSSEDVLDRLANAAAAFRGDPVLELLGDNPLVHSALINDVVDFFHNGGFDYVSSATTEFPHAGTEVPKFPIGVRVEAMRLETLQRAAQSATDPRLRDHSTAFLYENPDQFKVGYFPAAGDWQEVNRPELTFAVNYRENFELISQIFELCYPDDEDFPLTAAVKAFDEHPELKRLMGVPESP